MPPREQWGGTGDSQGIYHWGEHTRLWSPEREIALLTVMSNDQVTLWYHMRSMIVHYKIHRFPSSIAFRTMLSAGAEFVEKGSAKWLSDDTDNTVVREEDAAWGERVWVPRVMVAGLKYWAIILPKTANGQLNMKRLAHVSGKQGIYTQTFHHVDDAMNWLLSAG